MVASYPAALRWRVVYLLVQDNLSCSDIATLLKVSISFVKKVKRVYFNTGTVEYRKRRGKARKLDAHDLLLIKAIIEDFPETYEDEICDWVYYVTGKEISQSAVHRYLAKMGYTRRKLNVTAKERNEVKRAQYRRRISEFQRHQLLFIDESAKDERTFQRRYARALQGTGRISVRGNFTRGTRYSVLSAISIEGVQASQVITGAYDRDQFEFAMEHFILPLIGSAARHEPRSVVVMDNCNIHYSDYIINAIRDKGGIVIFLPPYSPDLNPIEDCFNFAKKWLQRNDDICTRYPKRCFEIALDKVTSAHSTGFFDDCGYFA